LAVESAIAGTRADVQIVIADNSDEPVAFGPLPPRVTLLHPERRVLPMSDNWERGLAAAKGEWLVYMGDKHRLVPGGIDALLKLAGGTLAVRYRVPQLHQSLGIDQVDDLASMRNAPGKLDGAAEPFRSRIVPAENILREWFRAVDYRTDLPMFYNTIVHHSVVRLVTRQFGTFFDSVSPDVSSSLVFGSQLESYRETSLPAVFLQWPNSDITRWSTGASALQSGQLSRTFLGELSENPIARDGFPPGFASGMMFEYRHFLRKWPAYRSSLRLPWRAFVEHSLRETFRAVPPNERVARVRHIARVTQSEGFDVEPLLYSALEVARRLAGEARHRVLGTRAPRDVGEASFDVVDGVVGAQAFLAKQLGESSMHVAAAERGEQSAALPS